MELVKSSSSCELFEQQVREPFCDLAFLTTAGPGAETFGIAERGPRRRTGHGLPMAEPDGEARREARSS